MRAPVLPAAAAPPGGALGYSAGLAAIAHVGAVVADGNVEGRDAEARPRSAGVAATQKIGLTAWDQATPKRV